MLRNHAGVLSLGALITVSCVPHAVADEKPAAKTNKSPANTIPTNTIATNSILFMQTWNPPALAAENSDSRAFKVQVVQKSPTESSGILQIFKDDKLLFFYDPGSLYPDSVVTLTDGNLATTWNTGLGSYCHLFVFTYAHGKARMVLHTVSNGLRPEFVYQDKGHIMGTSFQDKKGKMQVRGGPFFQQRIIVANAASAIPKGASKSELLPVTANIYTWDEKIGKYKVRSDVPWAQRLPK